MKKGKHLRIKQFSKILAMIVTILFVVTILYSLVVWHLQNRVPTEILDFVAKPFMVIVSGYYIKASVENYKKISQSSETEQQ